MLTSANFECRRKAWLLLGVLFCLTALLVFAAEGWSASKRQLSLEELVDLSQEIVVGRVSSSAARWQGRLIVTTTTIEVQEPIKGDPGPELEITQLGGTAVHPKIGAPVTMTVSGQVVFRPGEEVLLFITETKPGIRSLVGGAQGRFKVQKDPVSKRKKVPVGPKKLKALREDERIRVSTEEITLDEMSKLIRTHMEKKRRILEKKEGAVQ